MTVIGCDFSDRVDECLLFQVEDGIMTVLRKLDPSKPEDWQGIKADVVCVEEESL